MLTVENCRKILQDNGEEYTEEEIEKIREQIQKLCRAILFSTSNPIMIFFL